MSINVEKIGLYNIDKNYLKYLYEKVEQEIYYKPEMNYSMKPYLGIIVTVENYTYFIPLTSGKKRHLKMPLIGISYFLIYEIIEKNKTKYFDMVRKYDQNKNIKILSMLDIKKMIPVPKGAFFKIDFNEVKDNKYKTLLVKEYRFCKKIRSAIATKVESIYCEQKNTGRVLPFGCNFQKLETACDLYESQNNHVVF